MKSILIIGMGKFGHHLCADHHPGDPVVGHEEIGLVVLFELVQQVVDALGQLQHTFAAAVAVG